MEPELELDHDPEVAATPTQAPEQVRVLGAARAQDPAIRAHDRVRLDVVARQAELPGEPTHPAAERQPTHARVGDVAGRGRKAVGLGRAVEAAQQRTPTDSRAAPVGIDPDVAHRRQVDHQAAVRDAQAEDAMPAGTHPDLEAGFRPWRTAATTSSSEVQRAMSAGRRSTIAFQISRYVS